MNKETDSLISTETPFSELSIIMMPKQHYSDTGLTSQAEMDSKICRKKGKREKKERKRKTFLEEGRRRSSMRTLKSY